jgi:hypothetical protein
MSTDDRKWVTRKDAAALARCSQDSIVRAQTKHKLQTRTNDAKATMLNTDDLVRVGLICAEDLAARGPRRRGIAHLRVLQAEQLQSILSGDKPLPAATVAGDRLRRVAITCLWLQGSGHGVIVSAWSGLGFDLVAQGEVGAGVAGLGVGEVLAQLSDSGGGSLCW